MTDSLLIAVRFPEGRYHGRDDGFNGVDGWPPSPGRLFQALVAAVARGANLPPEDVRALKWLEGLHPPTIAAPAVRRGRAVKLFVPNNDLDSVGGDPARVSEIRVGKQWRPCFFNPDEPLLYVWDFESGLEEAERICAIAERVYQLGRGIDMAWACGRVLDPNEAETRLESHPGAVRRSTGAGETSTPRPGTLDKPCRTVPAQAQPVEDDRDGSQVASVVHSTPQGVLRSHRIRRTAAPPPFRVPERRGRFRSASAWVRGALHHRAAGRRGGSTPRIPVRQLRLVREADHRPGCRPRRSCPAHPLDPHSLDRSAAYGPLHPACRRRSSLGLPDSSRRSEVGVCRASTLRPTHRGGLARNLGFDRRLADGEPVRAAGTRVPEHDARRAVRRAAPPYRRSVGQEDRGGSGSGGASSRGRRRAGSSSCRDSSPAFGCQRATGAVPPERRTSRSLR